MSDIRNYHIDKTFLKRAKTLKTKIDEEEYYNGTINVFTATAITAGGSSDSTIGSLEELFVQLKQAGTGEVEILLKPDNSPRAVNGVWDIKWESNGAKRGEPGTSFWKRATATGEFSFSLVGDVSIDKKAFIFSKTTGSGEGEEIQAFYVIENVKKHYALDGIIIGTTINCISASRVLTDDDIGAQWFFTTKPTTPRNVKKLKISFDKFTIFNGIEITSGANDLVLNGHVQSVKATGWNLCPMFPTNFSNRTWKSEWPFEHKYYKNMEQTKSQAYNNGAKGVTMSHEIDQEVDTAAQAQSYFDKWFGSKESGGAKNLPDKIYGGQETNGWESTWLDYYHPEDNLGISRVPTLLASNLELQAWSQWFDKASTKVNTINVGGIIPSKLFIIEKATFTEPKFTSVNIPNGSVWYMPAIMANRKTPLREDDGFVATGGQIYNTWYNSDAFYKQFVNRIDLIDLNTFTLFPKTNATIIEKGDLKDYGSENDYSYECLIPAGYTQGTPIVSMTINGFVETKGTNEDFYWGTIEGGYDEYFLNRNIWNVGTAEFEDTTTNLPNDQTAILNTNTFNLTNKYFIEIELDVEYDQINVIELYAYGTGTFKIEFFDSNGVAFEESYENDLRSSIVSSELVTSKIWPSI